MLKKRSGKLKNHLSNLIALCDDCNQARNFKVYKNRVGVILAGGRGTRLYPLTYTASKHSLPIGLNPMIFYTIKTLRSFGIYKIMIVLDRNDNGDIMSAVGSGAMFGVDISYKIQEGAGGISEALYLAKGFSNNSMDEIVVILGDNIFDNQELNTDIDLNITNPMGDRNTKACVYVKKVSNPEDYGIAVMDEGRIVKIVEKPKDFIGNMAVLGLYVYTNDVFNIIEGVKPSKRGELEISSINDYYAQQGLLEYKEVNSYWADCGGSIQRYAEACLHGAKQAKVSKDEINEFVSVVFDDK
jgi:glucose-1-phosphate thymidylyltransferase